MTDDKPQYYQCYYCNGFSTNIENEYLRHGAKEHLYKPLFPNKTELTQYNLTAQDKPWEKPIRTEKEAEEHLARWAEKRTNEELKQEQRIKTPKK